MLGYDRILFYAQSAQYNLTCGGPFVSLLDLLRAPLAIFSR